MNDVIWTVLELLRWTTDYFKENRVETPRLDAECLLAAALGCGRLDLYLEFDKPIPEPGRARFREMVRQRAQDRVPVAQLVGRKEFWSLPLRITPDVLVPRPETETLVQVALTFIPQDVETQLSVLDLGTGSGAVALALAQERPGLSVTASDSSGKALEIAQENAQSLGFDDRVCFVHADGLTLFQNECFDLVVSNPPYLREDSKFEHPSELRHEPEMALYAGEDGMDVLRHIAKDAPKLLAPGGAVAVELAPEQAAQVRMWLLEGGLCDDQVGKDLAGRERVVSARMPQ